jgi:hypothetical protein
VEHRQRGLGGGGTLVAEDLAQRHAFDEFHHDRGAFGGLDVLVEPDHIGVLDRGQGRGLVAEHLSEHRVGPEFAAQVLDRDEYA